MIRKSKEVINDTVKQISGFQKGEITPLKTGIEHLDWASLGGLLPSGVTAILGLSFHGKTYFLEEIEANLFDTYGDDIIFVKCLWELELFKIVVRDMSKEAGISMREVLSKMPEKEIIEKYKKVTERYRKENIYLQEEPTTVNTFVKDIEEVIKKYPDKKIVVSIDNLENILVEGRNQKEVMDELIRKVNVLKKQHWFIHFIILNQLNRELMERVSNPQFHFPVEGDIYGTASLFKIVDVCVAVVNPYKMGLEKYGLFPKSRFKYLDEDFIVENGLKTNSFDGVGNIFYHYLKARGIEEEYDKRDIFAKRIFDRPSETNNFKRNLNF
jgi:KaiC/GvpD/RAD55 family RecA-like ATPase